MLNLTIDQINELHGKTPADRITLQSFDIFWRLFPELTFEAAVGGCRDLLAGKGQVRTERFPNAAEAPAVEPSADFIAAST